MTTETQPRMADRMLTLLMAQPATVQARYESKIVEARKGILSDTLAMQIIRQVAGFSSPAEGEAQRTMPRGDGSGHGQAKPKDGPSQAQVDLLNRLRVERGSEALSADQIAKLTKAQASADITAWIAIPRPKREVVAAAKAPVVELEAGIYQVGDDVYKVQKSRQSGRMYAQKHVGSGFDYESGRGAMSIIRPEHLMTTEQAAAFGQRFGMCVNGHPLSDRTSRYFGYGESCANRNGWTYDKKLVPADFE